MSGTENHPSSPANLIVAAKMTFWEISTIKNKGRGGKVNVTQKEKSSTKTKEFEHAFEESTENYQLFLRGILKAHGLEDQFEISDSSKCPFRAIIPPQRAEKYAINYDNLGEFYRLVKAINDMARPPLYLNILVDFKDIQANLKKATQRPSGQAGFIGPADEGPTIDHNLSDEEDMTSTDREIAACRKLLEDRWGNDHDKSYTFVSADPPEAIPLTPLMMGDWAVSLYENQSSIHSPSPALLAAWRKKKERILDPERAAAEPTAPSTPSTVVPTSDPLSQVSSMLQSIERLVTVTAGRSDSCGPPATPTRPSTPIHGVMVAPPGSPAVNTPSKLHRFLEWMSVKGGIPEALTLEPLLHQEKLGPDVLDMVAIDDLKNLGISTGDALRLRKEAPIWWKSAEAKKRPRAETNEGMWERTHRERSIDSVPPQDEDLSTRTTRMAKIRFHVKFLDEEGRVVGSHRRYGLRMEPVEGTPPPENPRERVEFWSEELGDWYPVPRDRIPIYVEDVIMGLAGEDM
ncbi:hypothetical protein HDZ31DRAFT_78420 [Schizophyllum fasciatum]